MAQGEGACGELCVHVKEGSIVEAVTALFLDLLGYMDSLTTYDAYNSDSPKSSTVFFHPFSVILSNGMPSFSLWTTHATPPIAVGSFLPFTGRP